MYRMYFPGREREREIELDRKSSHIVLPISHVVISIYCVLHSREFG